MTMAYVVVVNPQILAEGGMPVDGVLFATCVSAAIATVIMGLWANYPIALALTSTVTSYIESAAGVAVCARTGLGNLVIAALFLVAMFCAPLAAAIPAYATAPALILVWRAHVWRRRTSSLGRFQRRFPAISYAGCHAADFQHRHGPQCRFALLYFRQAGHRQAARD